MGCLGFGGAGFSGSDLDAGRFGLVGASNPTPVFETNPKLYFGETTGEGPVKLTVVPRVVT